MAISQRPSNFDLVLSSNLAMVSAVESSASSGMEKEGTSSLTKRDHNALEAELPEYTPGGAFETAGLETHYEPIDSYEGKHRYDPAFKWTENEEDKIVRKIDKRICSWVCLMFFALQLDRGNISQALSDNMLKDLHVNTNDYNTGQTIFYLCFLLAEVPSQLISKRVGPDRWVPIQMRLSWFWTAYQATQIVSAFLAFGILRLRGRNGMAGWQWLFALEGMITGLIGIASYFYLPPSPTQTASKLRGKDGWFNEHEEKIMVNRVLRDDPSKGDMHNRQALTFGMFWECVTDYHMWPIYLIGLSWMIPNNPATSYLTLQLKANGFGTFRTNLLTIPAYVLFIIGLLFWTWVSEKINQRFLVGLASQIWALPLLIALEFIPGSTSAWTKWALSTLLVGSPYVHAILVSTTSRNAGSVRLRTVASAFYNMCVQTSSIIGSNIYREHDKPMYRTGNKVLIAICCYNFALFIGAKLFYVHVNKKRAAIWDAMTHEQRDTYLSTTKDRGNKRLDFRFAH
ncbi:Methylthioribulose-1-phosphate dehydratase [Venturia inaequalis]|nr:Methylthioribulose-1-phosphate dehydratase [Venturia inaequalis]